MPNDFPTVAEARLMPTFWVVHRIARTSYSCPECAEHRAEPWAAGTACDAHTEEQVAPVRWRNSNRARYYGGAPHPDAELALKVLRAGGNPEPRYEPGTLGYAQWTYKPKGNKQARLATVRALTNPQPAAVAA